jgi:hypothetical protein
MPDYESSGNPNQGEISPRRRVPARALIADNMRPAQQAHFIFFRRRKVEQIDMVGARRKQSFG